MSDKRFEKEYIEKLLFDPTDSTFLRNFKKLVIVPILDFFLIYLLFIWVNLHLLLKFDFLIFLIGFEILLVLSFYWIYLVFIKYYLIKVNTYQIKVKDLENTIRFVFLSDIHIGKDYYGTNLLRLRRIIRKINKLNLDLVVIGGDFICEDIEE